MKIISLWRHPVKGFSPEELKSVSLVAGEHFPNDRMFAIEDGPSGFDADDPQHISKMRFVVLARSARIANYETMYLDDSKALEIFEHDENCICSFDMATQEGLDDLADWLTNRFGDEFKGPLRVIRAPQNHRFMDYKSGFVSLINASSVEALSQVSGEDIRVQRFRGNVVFEAPAWEEDNWLQGQILQLGNVRLEVLKPTVRCKATHADPNPDIASYNIETVPLLMTHFKRNTMGVYARIVSGGELCVGDNLSIESIDE
ncbi:MOSC domain-containing protein [Hirschia litorea]|uniref:MOSC domain-containing protein n=1 Tax=Hirschia litorea TaxID=1199156 RepID=A0ABW2IJI4_9PROT